jgi:hypothetical protein
VDSTGIPHEFIKAWTRLRHPVAHGAGLGRDQAPYDDCYTIVEIVYRMATWAIGYVAPLLHSSRRGWGNSDEARE